MNAELVQNSPRNRTEKTLLAGTLLVGAERNISGKGVVALKLYPERPQTAHWRYSLDLDVEEARGLVRLLQDRIAWIDSQAHQTCSIALSVMAPMGSGRVTS